MSESDYTKVTDDKLRSLVYDKYKRRAPFSVKRKLLVGLLDGKFAKSEQDKIFNGKKPDELGEDEIKRLPRSELKKIIRRQFGIEFPDSIDRSYMEKIALGKIRVDQMPSQVKMELGKANRELDTHFLVQFGLDKLPLLSSLRKNMDKEKGELLSKRFQDKKYRKSKYD